jgi:Phorbol esters/diacylglycerol binding domain (C1 domain)
MAVQLSLGDAATPFVLNHSGTMSDGLTARVGGSPAVQVTANGFQEGVVSNPGVNTGDNSSHDFTRAYFSSPTMCGTCGKFVWGVTKKQQRGLRCDNCGLKVHGRCGDASGTVCQQPSGSSRSSASSGEGKGKTGAKKGEGNWSWILTPVSCGSAHVEIARASTGEVVRMVDVVVAASESAASAEGAVGKAEGSGS